MANIHLTSFIAAPSERVFHLSRSISLHKQSMKAYEEQVISGRTHGLINEDEEVEWSAKHLFKNRKLKVKITAMQAPLSFTDEQVEGDFKRMKHEHVFKPCDNGTIMIDLLEFEAPYGFIGKAFTALYLKSYMKKLLEERNKIIKQIAEGNNWTVFLNT